MIEIVYAGNTAVLEGITLSALSAVMRTKENLRVHIFTMDLRCFNEKYSPITEEDCQKLERMLCAVRGGNEVVRHDFTERYLKSSRTSKRAHSSYTPYCLLRLFLTHEEGLGDKAIYLDADTMVNRDINELYSIDISRFELAGVLDAMGRHWIYPSYINSGVLLLNIKNLKRTGGFDKALDYALSHSSFLVDQDAINKFCRHKLYLPSRFNNQRKMTDDTVVKHFCKILKFFPFLYTVNIKQWHREKVHSKLKIYAFDDVYALYDKLKGNVPTDEK